LSEDLGLEKIGHFVFGMGQVFKNAVRDQGDGHESSQADYNQDYSGLCRSPEQAPPAMKVRGARWHVWTPPPNELHAKRSGITIGGKA
jgi:hypothetical protein